MDIITITPGQRGPGSDGNEVLFHVYQTGASPLDSLVSYAGRSLKVCCLPLCKGAVNAFYCPSRLGFTQKSPRDL